MISQLKEFVTLTLNFVRNATVAILIFKSTEFALIGIIYSSTFLNNYE